MNRTITIGSELSLQLALILWFIRVDEDDELVQERHFGHFLAVEFDDLYVSFTGEIDNNDLLGQFIDHIELASRNSGMNQHRAKNRRTALRPLGLYPHDYVKLCVDRSDYRHEIDQRYISKKREHVLRVLSHSLMSDERKKKLFSWCEGRGVNLSKFRPTLKEVANEVLGGMIYGPNTIRRRIRQMAEIFDLLMRNDGFAPDTLEAQEELHALDDQGDPPPLFPTGPIPEEWIISVCGDEAVANLRSKID